jgi:hypothetical protein
MVTAEAVMLTCVIDAKEERDVAVVDIPNAFVQTVVSEEDAEHHVVVRIRGPLVDILVSIVPDVYGPYVSTTKTCQKVLIVECLNTVYGTMVAALLYYKKLIPTILVWLTRSLKGSRSPCVFMLMIVSYPMSTQR